MDQDAVRVLVITKAAEYVHDSGTAVAETLLMLGSEFGWFVTMSARDELPELDEYQLLIDQFDVLFFAQTSGNILSDKQLDVVKLFSETSGKGCVGWHASADTHRDDPRFSNIFGAVFVGHPREQEGRVKFDQTEGRRLGLDLPESITVVDEFYNFDRNIAIDKSAGFRALAYVDESSYKMEFEKPEWEGSGMGDVHPIVWYRDINGCRSFYCALGHSIESYKNMALRQLLVASVNWASYKRELNNPKQLQRSVQADLDPLQARYRDSQMELAVVKASVDHFSILITYNALANGQIMSRVVPERDLGSTHFLITDSTVGALYADAVEGALRSSGIQQLVRLTVPDGEDSKSVDKMLSLIDGVLGGGVDKHSCIITLGGGMINNLGGMVAATVYRGLRLVHFGTSLLGQVDAAVGIKQAVNWRTGKNQIGALYAPSLVILDTKMLETLPHREKKNGMGEAIKHALAQNPAFLQFLMEHSEKDLEEPSFLFEVVRASAADKAVCLNSSKSVDYTEMIMQYGHALGHAIEHLSEYKMRHGEAISIGMTLSCEVGILLGHGDPVRLSQLMDLHLDVFSRYGLPWQVPSSMSDQDICDTLRFDKHYLHTLPTMMTLKDIAVPYESAERITGLAVPYEIIEAALRANRARTYQNSAATKEN